MQGLKIVDQRLGFPAGVYQIIQIVPNGEVFVIEVTDLRAGTKIYWATESGEVVTFASHQEAENCLLRFQDIIASLDLGPYPPIPF